MSLGYRPRHDHIAARRPNVVGVTSVAIPTPATPSVRGWGLPSCPVPRGLVPTLTYSLFALAIPILCLFTTPDYTKNEVLGVTIGVSALAGIVVILANDCCCWYNMMLFFHIGVEAKVVDIALSYVDAEQGSGDTDHNPALAITAAVILIVHLIPFLFTDRIAPLILLAYVGVVVNTATVVYISPDYLLLVAASSLALLSTTMIVGGICEIRTSIASLVVDSVDKKKCLTCDGFEL